MSTIEKKDEEVEQKTAEIQFDDNEGFVFNTGVFDSNALSALNSICTSLESLDQKSASVKFMITMQDIADLKALGYSCEQIDRLKPQDAEDIIKSGTKAEPPNEK